MPTTQLTYRTREGDVTNAADWGVVFLSYRKKNVVYRNDVVRDILDANDCAVWFDRNLTAGEDYNAEIDAALDRMNVFVLLVTPLTFEPDCYVMKKEIPRALERKIPIIPVILEETDMERFAKVLGNIHSLDKRKPDEYEDGLRKALSLHLLTKDEKERIHMAQRESAPRAAQTIYLQGLGWLTGENCERDPDRGAQMITAAAMSGECPEAVLRLAQMYETGDGVARSWNAAIDWYGRYTAAMEPRFGQNEDDDESIAKAYDSRGILLRDSGRLTAAREAFTAYNRHCEQMVAHYGGKSERALSISYNRLGDVCMADGDLSGAKEYYLKDLAISEQLAKQSEGTDAQRDLSISYNKLGDVCKADGDLSGAKAYYLKDLAISEQLAKQSEGTDAQRDLSISYNKLGDVCKADGDLSGAKAYYLKDLAISEQLAKQSEGTQAQDDLGISYAKLALIEGWEAGERKAFAQKAKEIFDQQYQTTGLNSFKEKADAMTVLLMLLSFTENKEDNNKVDSTENEETPSTELDSSIEPLSDEAPSAEVNRIPLSSDVSVPASGGRKKTPLGWLLVLLMAVIAAGAAVQLTGAFDLLGWLRGLFG